MNINNLEVNNNNLLKNDLLKNDLLKNDLDDLDIQKLLLTIDNSVRYKVKRLLNLKNYHSSKLYDNLEIDKDNLDKDNLDKDNLDKDNLEIDKDNLDKDNLEIDKDSLDIDVYYNLFNDLKRYKLLKTNKVEDHIKKYKKNEVHISSMDKIEDCHILEICNILFLGLKKGIILEKELNNICFATPFYKKKNKLENMTFKNSRCLLNVNNKLKILNKFLRDTFICPLFNPVFYDLKYKLKKNINQDINRARKVIVHEKNLISLNFQLVSDISIYCINSEYGKIQLDLSNAFNNVNYDFLRIILNEYMDVNLFNNILNENERKLCKRDKRKILNKIKKNFVNLFIYIVSNIKYYDDKIIKYINKSNELKKNSKFETHIITNDISYRISLFKKNKGVPQGCTFSTDIFIMCMDYILKKVIKLLDKKLNLVYDVDYNLICYVDDIMILLMSNKSYTMIEDILIIFNNCFIKYNFIMNKDKTRFCKKCLPYIDLDKYGNNILKNNDKFLGIYYENDIEKYLELINLELIAKFNQDEKKHSLYLINSHIKHLEDTKRQHELLKFLNKGKFKLRLEGSLRYRLSKFINQEIKPINKQYQNLLFHNKLENLSKYIFN
jgi:hypothetical protein